MLTAQQHKIFMDCARQMSLAALVKHGEVFKTECKLDAYNTLLEPPASIRSANCARAKKLRKQTSDLWELYKRVDKIQSYIAARPSSHTYTSTLDGSNQTFVMKGWLPDYSPAPEDEAKALEALDDYYAREAQAS